MASGRLLIVSTVAVTLKGFLLPFADHFRSLGWRVDGAAREATECAVCRPYFDALFSIEWSRSPFDLAGMWTAARRLRALVAENRYDIVHVHTPIAAFVTRAALAWPLPTRPVVVYTAHGFHFTPGRKPLVNLIFKIAEKVAGRWTDYLVTINRTDESAALRLRIVPPERLRYMPGIGIDRNRFSPVAVDPGQTKTLRQSLGLSDTDPAFVMVAEFVPNKRHTDVIAALSRARNRNAHVLFVGDGSLRSTIEKQAADSGVLPRVHFAGMQTDVRPWILVARALLLVSFREGLPRSIMEALCCGVPIIGSDIRGTRDLLADGGGKLFPPGDVHSLAQQMDWFADNPDTAHEMGSVGCRHMEKYDIANVIALHDELYATAMRERAQ